MGFEIEAFSGTVIEALHGECELVRGNGIEAHLLRKELANQAVHILVRITFPRGIGMREEEVCVEFFGDTLMLRKRLALVGCQCMNGGRKGISREIMESDTACAVLNGTCTIRV